MADPNPTYRGHIEHKGGYAMEVIHKTETLWVWRCDACHFLVAECLHVHNTWHDADGNALRPSEIGAGVTLLCDFCGIDGT